MSVNTNRRRRGRRRGDTYARVRDGQLLRRVRERKGYSLRKMAYLVDQAGAWTTIGKLERGNYRTCSLDLAERIAHALDREVIELFDP